MENLILNTDTTPVVILGTGGFAIELAGLLHGIGIQVLGFIGPNATRKLPARWLGGDEVLGGLSTGTKVLVAIGASVARRKVIKELERQGLLLATFVHPNAYVSPQASVGEGCIIYPNVTVHAGVVLGKGVLVNSNTTIGHETNLGDFSSVGPGVAIGGCCQFGAMTYIGIGASTMENLRIADGVLLGAGAILISDALEAGTYVGVPARKLTP